jgi:antirestriction protein ArdC
MDVYAIVTEKIINLLENGVVPWRRPWTWTGQPRNLVSKKPYRGVNLFLLSASKYVSPFWLTMRQANQLGGHVRKGEESTVVVFWKIEDSNQSGNNAENDESNARRFLLRYYRVFNLEQFELPQTVLDKLPKMETREHSPISACAEIIGCMPNAPEIQHAGSKAFYSALTDRVTLPPPELFTSAEEYYATGFQNSSTARVIRSGSRANQSSKPRRLDRRRIAARNSLRRWAPPTFVPKGESRLRSSKIRPPTFPAG